MNFFYLIRHACTKLVGKGRDVSAAFSTPSEHDALNPRGSVEVARNSVVTSCKSDNPSRKETGLFTRAVFGADPREWLEGRFSFENDNCGDSRIYTVQLNDTLPAIAEKIYGHASDHKKIFDANKPMLSDPDKIYPGQVLRIP